MSSKCIIHGLNYALTIRHQESGTASMRSLTEEILVGRCRVGGPTGLRSTRNIAGVTFLSAVESSLGNSPDPRGNFIQWPATIEITS